ncbi:hypothetical protein M9Y10_013001 [Tritrichomonas musculus]|uniref:Uncharacterized protein n=1 Tax=Tritrichomonas musculus TaxID=1915356 RepID=A0ABR2I5V4_9EUKA
MSVLPRLSVPNLDSNESSSSPSSASIEMSSSDSDNGVQFMQMLKPQLPATLPPIQSCIARNLKKMSQLASENNSNQQNENQDLNNSAASSPKATLKDHPVSHFPNSQLPQISLVIPNSGKSARSLLNRNRCANSVKKYKGNLSSVVLPPMQDSIYSNMNIEKEREKEKENNLTPLSPPPPASYLFEE